MPGEWRDHRAQCEQKHRCAFQETIPAGRILARPTLAQPQPAEGERQQEQRAAAIERRQAEGRAGKRPTPQTRPSRYPQHSQHRQQQQEHLQVGREWLEVVVDEGPAKGAEERRHRRDKASLECQPADEIDQQTTKRAQRRLDRLQGDDVVTEKAVDCAEKERVQGRAEERLPAGPFVVHEAKRKQVVVAGVNQAVPKERTGGVLCEIGETHRQGAEKDRDGRNKPSAADLG